MSTLSARRRFLFQQGRLFMRIRPLSAPSTSLWHCYHDLFDTPPGLGNTEDYDFVVEQGLSGAANVITFQSLQLPSLYINTNDLTGSKASASGLTSASSKKYALATRMSSKISMTHCQAVQRTPRCAHASTCAHEKRETQAKTTFYFLNEFKCFFNITLTTTLLL